MAENKIPTHVAIVMDGNGRWAKKRLMPRSVGHKAGGEAVKRMVKAAVREGVKVLTLFAFSSENWQRPEEEVNQLMELFLDKLDHEVPELNQQQVRLRFIGERKALREILQTRIAEAEALTAGNDRLQLVVAVNYGGQWDILQACQNICEEVTQGRLDKNKITPEIFTQQLSTQDLPSVDLFIRTSGELRISNFLLWQCAYAELYFTDVLWPDFDHQCFKDALEEYAKRQRRFGK